MKKILVPCDFSAVSIEAFKVALDIAARVKGEINVLFAIDLPVFVGGFDLQPYLYDPNLAIEMKAWAETKFHELSSFNSHRIPMKFLSKQTSVAEAVKEAISNSDIDLVVVGTHGSHGANEFMFGSNAEKVVRFSSVPVLTVRNAVPLSSIKKILFPTDLSLNHPGLIHRVKKLQEFLGASLDILWVNTPDEFHTDGEIRALMQDFVKETSLRNYSLYIANARDIEGGIIGYAKKSKADMIAMATHGRRGLAHLMDGSLAEDVVNHNELPIWTYSLHAEKYVNKIRKKIDNAQPV
jgi:nucleotide-binding universal stress UspA family protein